MTIDLTIQGDTGELHALADWIETKVSVSAEEIIDRLKKAADGSEDFWQGRSGEGFRETARAVAASVDPVKVYASDFSAVLRAYANRLRRGRDAFDDYRERALETALLVSDDIITMPLKPPTFATPAGAPLPGPRAGDGTCNPTAGEDYSEALELYKEIAAGVGEWWGNLDNWVEEHFTPLMARVTDFDSLAQSLETLKHGHDVARSVCIGLAGVPWEERLKAMQEAAKQAQIDSDNYYRKLRSGDPSVKAAATKVTKQEVRAAADMLAEKVGKLEVGTKIVIPGVGLVIDIVLASVEVANGGSVSSEAVGIAAGAGAGFATAALLGPAAPLAVVAVAAAVIATGAGILATDAWEDSVPLDVREAIDAGDFAYLFR